MIITSTISNKFFQARVDPLLDEIDEKSDELRSLYKLINDRLRQVESALNEAAPGVFAWMRDGKFGYGKDLKSKRWGFLSKNSKGEIASIWEGGVSERIELSQCLEDLMIRIRAAMDLKSERVESAIAQIEEFLEALRECQKKRRSSEYRPLPTSSDKTPGP